MPPALRRAQILQRIQREGGVSVADLARELTVSSITVHRDLEHLSRDGLVERVHGGARSMPAAGIARAPPCTRSTSPSLERSSRSRWTVIDE